MRNLLLGLLLLVLAPALASAADEANWGNLQRLRVGQKIEVVQTDSKKLKGTFLSFSDEAISLRVGKDEVGVQRPNVLRVSLRGRPKRSTSAIVGAAIGALVGVGVGALAATPYGSGDPGSESLIVFLGTTIGAGAGAGVGAAVPFIPSYQTIYRANKQSGRAGAGKPSAEPAAVSSRTGKTVAAAGSLPAPLREAYRPFNAERAACELARKLADAKEG